VNIERSKYDDPNHDDMVRALLAVVPTAEPGVRFTELEELVRPHLSPHEFPVDRSTAWYVTTIRLDLEARGALRRVPGKGPQRLVRTA
jgi:hypothetical protein